MKKYPGRPFFLIGLAVFLVVVEEILAAVMIHADVATRFLGTPTVKGGLLAVAFVGARVLAIGIAPALVCAAAALLVGAHFSSSGASTSVAAGAGATERAGLSK